MPPRNKPRTTGTCDCGCKESLNVKDSTYYWKCIRYNAKYSTHQIIITLIVYYY